MQKNFAKPPAAASHFQTNMVRTHLIFILGAIFFLPARLFSADVIYEPSAVAPPTPVREFRAAWVATVANIDWPSKPGLSVVEQKTELLNLLDRAAQLKFNAVLFQVRAVSDAFYASPIEPWSEYLTGRQGQAPSPFYDPLAFAVTEAHKRGLELHAWFNPFRAGHPESKSPPAQNHVTRTHPEIVRHYGRQIWLDPGEPEAQARAINAVLDVVKHYDVDGIVLDDYFYPYPEKNWLGRELDFPDDASWKIFGIKSGLTRDDWRRKNINEFVQKISRAIKAVKPQVQFGISPFGIWRPQNPQQIRGLDAYAKLYADSRLWLASGWVDFLAPQLYWPISQREQSFPVLLNWWRAQNPMGRHVWPAIADSSVGEKFSADEIARQIQILREQSVNSGEIHFHLRSILENRALTDAVRAAYAPPALVPASPWIDSTPPGKPQLTVKTEKNSTRASWEISGAEQVRWWLLQFRANAIWTTEIFPANETSRTFENLRPDAIALRAVDRLGNASEPVVLSPRIFLPTSNGKGAVKLK
jgi:uncharacterized lipoprotein YddW (UPF0748 family)